MRSTRKERLVEATKTTGTILGLFLGLVLLYVIGWYVDCWFGSTWVGIYTIVCSILALFGFSYLIAY